MHSIKKTLLGASIAFAGACNLLAQTNVGSDLFTRECATCHLAANADRAPSLTALRELAPEAILTALTTGRMAAQAQRLSPADRAAVAEFVAGRPIAAAAATSGGKCDASTAASKLGDAFQ